MKEIDNKFKIGDVVLNKIYMYDLIFDEDSNNNYKTYIVVNLVYEDSQYKYRFQDIDDRSNFEKTPVHLGNVNYVKRSEVNGAKIMREEIDDATKEELYLTDGDYSP
jgi:beta-N-acetylglucosaminidase